MPKHRKRRHRDSSSEDEDILRRKIKKLERRLAVKQNDRDRSPSFSIRSEVHSRSRSPARSHVSENALSSFFTENDNIEVLKDNMENTQREALEVDIEAENREEIPSSELNEAILEILGEAAMPNNSLAPALHKDVSARWTLLLKNGLTEEEQNNIVKKYPPPENCLLLESPKLNAEVAAVINEQVTRRDTKLVSLQSQLGAALSALGQLLTSFLSEEGGGRLEYIRLASDAGRLLLDLHHKQSITRRDLLSLNLRKDLKDTLTNVPVDGWLFGDNLGDRVKATKDLEKSSSDLKPHRPKVLKKGPDQVSKERFLNYRRPPRQAHQGVNQGGRQPYSQAPGHQRRSDPRKSNTSQERRRPRLETQRPGRPRDRYRP